MISLKACRKLIAEHEQMKAKLRDVADELGAPGGGTEPWLIAGEIDVFLKRIEGVD